MHKEINRIVEGANTAVLFIHGIAGTPNHFKKYIPLVPNDWSICNILLDGHGKGVKDFSKTRKLIPELSTPCFVYQSKKDELVAFSSCKILRKNSNIHINVLEKSSHFYYEESDDMFLIEEFEKKIIKSQ